MPHLLPTLAHPPKGLIRFCKCLNDAKGAPGLPRCSGQDVAMVQVLSYCGVKKNEDAQGTGFAWHPEEKRVPPVLSFQAVPGRWRTPQAHGQWPREPLSGGTDKLAVVTLASKTLRLGGVGVARATKLGEIEL